MQDVCRLGGSGRSYGCNVLRIVPQDARGTKEYRDSFVSRETNNVCAITLCGFGYDAWILISRAM